MNINFIILVLFFSLSTLYAQTKYDIVVVGGSASGICAGLQSSRMGAKTLIVEETTWLGGMLTSAGVSAIDGNKNLPAGIFGEFKRELVNYYGNEKNLATGWVSNILFEPSVGDRILKKMASKEKNLSVWYESSLKEVIKEDKIWKLTLNKGNEVLKVETKILIDATELGDIAKMVGLKYDIGMDSKNITNEDIAAVNANDIVQDLTYVAILKDYKKDMIISKPMGYDSTLFACCCQNNLCTKPKGKNKLWSKQEMLNYGKLPNGKYMINWPIEGNDYYVNMIDMSPLEREDAIKKAKNFTLCFVYFIQKELGYTTYYLDDTEFDTNDLLPHIPYHRESRRIHGKVRFTINHITNPYADQLYRTAIAVGDYPVDHHHYRYHGADTLPDLHFYPIPSYGLPLGTLLPDSLTNFIVAEKSISVTNLVNGSTRLQPVVMQIGQTAGTLAAICVKQNKEINQVSIREIQKTILDNGGYLLPYLDVSVSNPLFKPLQRIGATGILRGFGKNVDWSNQTWIYPKNILTTSDLLGLNEYFPDLQLQNTTDTIIFKNFIEILSKASKNKSFGLETNFIKELNQLLRSFGYHDYEQNRPILRGEAAIIIDKYLQPFEKREIDIYGKLID